MMRNFLLIVLLVVGSILVGFGTYKYANPDSYTYTGRIVFVSEQEYSQFKQFLVDHKEIDISNTSDRQRLTILSSSPPIIVDYKLQIASNINFAYDYDEKKNIPPLELIIGMVCLVGGMVFTYIFFKFSGEDD